MAVEQMHDLYWLGYLLTGDRERSVANVIETLDMQDAANPFFEDWMVTWSRKIFIAKVLGYGNPEANADALRSRLRLLQAKTRRAACWCIDAEVGKAELERALLAIDRFSRCALLLTVFEKLSSEDAGILLNANVECVKIATEIGLMELSRNLAGGQNSTVPRAAKASSFDAIPAMTA